MTQNNWKWVAMAGSMVLATLLKRSMGKGYKKLYGKEPPDNPAQSNVKIGEALLWTVVVSVAGGMAKLLLDSMLAHKYDENAAKLEEINNN